MIVLKFTLSAVIPIKYFTLVNYNSSRNIGNFLASSTLES